jgi:hypothetical protein
MASVEKRSIKACCSGTGAVLKVSFDGAQIGQELASHISKFLQSKGIICSWNDESEEPELLVRVVRMDQGSQLLRYFLAFSSPAVLEVEGRVMIDAETTRPFHITERANVGIMGGSGLAMLKKCAYHVAIKVGHEVMNAFQAW